MNDKKPKSELSLFLSCSVSLILISLFVLIDIEKFNQIQADSASLEENKLTKALKENGHEEEIKKTFLVNCFMGAEKGKKITEPTLSDFQISTLSKSLDDMTTELPEDVLKILKIRNACGFVKNKFSLTISEDKKTENKEIYNLLVNYVNVRHQMRSVLKTAALEVSM